MVNIYEAGPFEGRLQQWPVLAVAGSLEVRLAETDHEVEQAQRLRYCVFYEEMSAIPSPQMRALGRDFDKYDDVCDHLLVVDRETQGEDGQPLVVATYRLTREKDAARAGGFYTAGEYDIAPMLNGLPAGTKFLELGRSCVLKSYRSRPGTMQLLWKRPAMAYVARFDIDLMFRLRLAAGHRCRCAGAAALLSASLPPHAGKSARHGTAGIVSENGPRAQRRHPGARGPAQPAAAAQGLCARGLLHRQRRGD